MLSEALLDAEMRVGELFKQIPKAVNQHKSAYDTSVVSTMAGASLAHLTKEKTIRNLGFTPKQAERFETLADHPDLVEQVKIEARENDDLPTRSAVLSLAKYREQKTQSRYRQIDDDGRLAETLSNAVDAVERLPADRAALDAMVRGLLPLADNMLYSIGVAIKKLIAIQHAFERSVR
jgi:DNA repair ATPase RecN